MTARTATVTVRTATVTARTVSVAVCTRDGPRHGTQQPAPRLHTSARAR